MGIAALFLVIAALAGLSVGGAYLLTPEKPTSWQEIILENNTLTAENTVTDLEIIGITQLEAAKQRQWENVGNAGFNLADAGILMQKIQAEYQRQQLPAPSISVGLNAIASSKITVRVVEKGVAEQRVTPNVTAPAITVQHIVLASGEVAKIVVPAAVAKAQPSLWLSQNNPQNTAKPAVKTPQNQRQNSGKSAAKPPKLPLKPSQTRAKLPQSAAVLPPTPVFPPQEEQKNIQNVKRGGHSADERATKGVTNVASGTGKEAGDGVDITANFVSDISVKLPQNTAAPVGDFLEAGDTSSNPILFDTQQVAGDDELFLELRVDERRRLDFFVGIQNNGQIFLPLGEILGGLGFPITVNAGAGTATGWFIKQEQNFTLNVSQKTLNINKKALPWPTEDVLVTEYDIYVSLGQMEAWFPLELEVSYTDLILYAKSTATLPEKAAFERRKIWEAIDKQKNSGRKTNGPAHILPYQAFALPTLRLDAGSNLNRSETGDIQTSQNLQIQAQGDILGFSGHVTGSFAQGTGTGNSFGPRVEGVSIRLTRDDTTGQLLGPLNASRVEVGDVNAPITPLIGTQNQGRGVTISNQPSNFISNLNTFELEGFAPLGWDIEVYLENNLVAFEPVPADGRYRFTNLPLRTGVNTFRILLYGPQGEREERVETFTLGAGQIAEGAFLYEASLLQSNQPLIQGENEIENNGASAAVSGVYGVNRNLSLLGGLYAGAVDNEDTGYVANAGARFSFGKTVTQGDIATSDIGQAYSAIVRTRLAKQTDLALSYSGFIGELQEREDSQSTASVDITHKFSNIFNLNSPLDLALGYRRETLGDGTVEQTWDTRQSTQFYKLAISHELEHVSSPFSTRTDGNLSVSSPFGGTQILANINYSPDVEDWVRTAQLGTQLQIWDDTFLNVDASHTFGQNGARGLTSLNTALNFPLGKTVVRLNSRVDSTGAASLGVGFGLNLTPQNPLTTTGSLQEILAKNTPKYTFQPQGIGFGFGSVRVHAFEDYNGNKRPDAGEQNVAGVNIRNEKSGRSIQTDAGGQGILHDIPPLQETVLSLDPTSLPDIYLAAKITEYNIIAHVGYSGQVYFPIERLGEIAGVVSSLHNEELRILANLPLELYTADGTYVAKTVSEYDGFYSFGSIPLGAYTVTVPVPEAQTLGFTPPKPVAVTLTPKQAELADVAIMVEQATRDEADIPTLDVDNTTVIY